MAGVSALRPVGVRPYLRQDAADELRRFVLETGLQPGEKLPSERELGARLGLSRASVREALRFLEHEGLVEVRQGRQAVVRPFDLAPMLGPVVQRLAAERGVLRDLLDVRTPLELLAARAAARQRTDADLRELQACLARTRAALDGGEDPLDEDVLFHDLLYRASRNTVLLAFSRTVHDLLRSVREAARQVGDGRDRSIGQHIAIYEAVAAGDEELAEAAMRRHMDEVRAEQEQALRFLDQVAKRSRAENGRANASSV
ncbi:MAG: FadR family transcriptional regulator [Chloroflexi bacterium]|nr:FadR family transcriptional regulator [Chloroflexota bacterium]